MVELGYYSNRLEQLEKRKEKLQGDLVIAKFGLKGVNKEIEACKEQMNNLTQVINDEADKKDKIILEKKKKKEEWNKINNGLKKENDQLKHDLNGMKLDLRIEKRKNEKLQFEPESELIKKIDSLRDERLNLKKENSRLKKELEKLKKEFNEKELDRIMSIESGDDIIISDNFGKDNIFDKIRKS